MHVFVAEKQCHFFDELLGWILENTIVMDCDDLVIQAVYVILESTESESDLLSICEVELCLDFLRTIPVAVEEMCIRDRF